MHILYEAVPLMWAGRHRGGSVGARAKGPDGRKIKRTLCARIPDLQRRLILPDVGCTWLIWIELDA